MGGVPQQCQHSAARRHPEPLLPCTWLCYLLDRYKPRSSLFRPPVLDALARMSSAAPPQPAAPTLVTVRTA